MRYSVLTFTKQFVAHMFLFVEITELFIALTLKKYQCTYPYLLIYNYNDIKDP